jgi:hypothetical protein
MEGIPAQRCTIHALDRLAGAGYYMGYQQSGQWVR